MVTDKKVEKLQKIKDRFIEKAKQLHGDKYDYDHIDYKDSRTKVKILCNKHNEYFYQRPSAHLQGQNCPLCGKESADQKNLKDQSLVESQLQSNLTGGLTYKPFLYTSTFQKIEITCSKGHIFKRSVHECVSKPQSCPECNVEMRKKNFHEKFLIRAKELHEGFYDYSKVIYDTNHKKVVITCPLHGDFQQSPNKHLMGRGCPECAKGLLGRWFQNPEKENLFKNEDNNLYVLCLKDGVYKVGISKNVESRLSSLITESGIPFTLVHKYPMSTWDAMGLEKEVHKRLKTFRYVSDMRFGGYTELFELDKEDIIKTIEKVMEEYDYETESE